MKSKGQLDLINSLTDSDLLKLVSLIGKDSKVLSISSVLEYFGISSHHTACRKLLSSKMKACNIPVHSTNEHKRTYSVDQLITIIESSECWADIYKQLNMTASSHNKKTIIKFMQNNNIVVPTFNLRHTYRRGKKQFTFETIFVKNSSYSRQSLRGAVIRFNVKEYRCEKCGNTGEWMDEIITLELDHINGVSDDNRTSNLRWLCPNCHSQTPTFRNSAMNKGSVA